MKNIVYLLLLNTTLLAGCKDKKAEEPAPVELTAPLASSGYITCNQDGTIRTSQARAFYEPASSTFPYEVLRIRSVDPNTGVAVAGFMVGYIKPVGAADTEYRYLDIAIDTKGQYYKYGPQASISKSSTGWSGTFSGTFTPDHTREVYSTVGGGSFTNIKE